MRLLSDFGVRLLLTDRSVQFSHPISTNVVSVSGTRSRSRDRKMRTMSWSRSLSQSLASCLFSLWLLFCSWKNKFSTYCLTNVRILLLRLFTVFSAKHSIRYECITQLLFMRNRSRSASSDSAYFSTFFRTAVCLSVVCHTRAPCVNR